MKKYQCMVQEKGHGLRLDLYLFRSFDMLSSRAAACTLIEQGQVEIDGQVCTKPSTRLRQGQCLVLFFSGSEKKQFFASTSTPLPQILFQDDDILVLNKPSGLTVHPAPSVKEPTLVEVLLAHYPQFAQLGGDRPGFVHRLDKDTSGLLVVAKKEPCHLALVRQFAAREVKKEYLAFVLGVPEEKSGEISVPLGRHPTLKTRMAVVKNGGKEARSCYRVLWSAEDSSLSLLSVQIFTGRTHQIRVHLSFLGHPVLGDATYGGQVFSGFGSKAKHLKKLAGRQLLHAWKLGFSHPSTGENLFFVQPPPADFLRVFLLACRRPLKIGLTGLASCGKSTVLRELSQMGIPVWSADEVVSRFYLQGEDGWHLLRARFGDRFFSEKNEVDKKALLQAMLENRALVREVEELLHPLVLHDLEVFFSRQETGSCCVAEVPLLVEAGWQKKALFDLICTVFVSKTVREKCLAQRGWTENIISQIDSWQCDQAQKVRAADLVLSNTGTPDDLRRQSRALIKIISHLYRKRIIRQKKWYERLVESEQPVKKSRC